MVVAVVAHPADEASTALVSRWAEQDARLLTSADLRCPWWVVRDGGGPATAVLAGEPVPEWAIEGVLVRIGSIEASELAAIAPEDREYCAAEMTAFLKWWLVGLPVPVINQPTGASLTGPGWRPATWHLVAQRLGLVSATMRWRASQERAAHADGTSQCESGAFTKHLEVVTVVANHTVVSFDKVLAGQAVLLAEAAGAAALDVAFDTGSDPPQFLWADPWVDICNPSVANALLESLVNLKSDRVL
jgi:hypothetical protein